MRQKLDQLNRVEQLAKGSVLTRFFNDPYKYIKAMYLLKVSYPNNRKGVLKDTELFFGDSMQVLLPAATDIYLTGGKTHDSEIRLAKYLIKTLKSGDVVIDIGAHFGYFTLLASSLIGYNGKVMSIEPAKGSFDLLRKNIAGKDNINIFHRAISDMEETVSFFEFPVLYSEYNALSIDQFEQEEWIKKHPPEKTKVQAVTIDSFAAEYKVQPTLIKIDVEGAEVQAIRGGGATWADGAPIVVMEYLTHSGDSYKKATAIMLEHGYRSCMIDDEGELVVTEDIEQYMSERNVTSENVVFVKGNK